MNPRWDDKGGKKKKRIEAFLPFYHFTFNTFSWSYLMQTFHSSNERFWNTHYVLSTAHSDGGRTMNRTGTVPALTVHGVQYRRKSKTIIQIVVY